jgi:hypothetical protein
MPNYYKSKKEIEGMSADAAAAHITELCQQEKYDDGQLLMQNMMLVAILAPDILTLHMVEIHLTY